FCPLALTFLLPLHEMERAGVRLPSQNARLPVCTQLNPFGGRKNPFLLPSALPVAGQEPVTCFAGMAFARPFYEPLFQQIIVSAQGWCRDDSIVVGDPSYDQRIELCNDLRLRSCLQLLQLLIDGSKVALVRFLTGSDDGLHPQRVLLPSRTPG